MTREEKLSKSLKERWKNGSFKGTTGRRMPDTEREKHSASLRGKIPKNLAQLNANRFGKNNPMFGRKETEEHKKWRMRNSVGRTKSLAERIKLSKSNSGKNGSNWKGGISPVNKIIRKGIEFRLWREAVFARDNWTCQKYKIRGGKLHPHHIKNFSQFPELRFAIDNGITLSEKAHKEFHDKFGRKNNTKEQLNQYLYGN